MKHYIYSNHTPLEEQQTSASSLDSISKRKEIFNPRINWQLIYFIYLIRFMKLIAVGLLAIMGVSCTSDKKDTVWWGNEKTTIELKNELALANYRASQLGPVEKVGEDRDLPLAAELMEEIVLLKNLRDELKRSVAEMDGAWDDFRSNVLESRRAELTGKTFATFQTADGKTYREVMVTKIDNGGVSLRHGDGTARLRFNDLDSQEQCYFGLDGELAATAIHTEHTRRIAYDQWIGKGLAAAEKKQAAQAKSRRDEERELASTRSLAAARQTSSISASVSPLTSSFGGLGETSTFSTGSSRHSRRYSSYGSYYSRPTVYYYNSTPSCPQYSVPSYGSGGCLPVVPWR